MTEYHLFESVMAKIALAAFFVVLFLLASGNIIRTNVHARDLAINLDKVTAAYLAEDCLKNGTDYINISFLDANHDTNMCDLCDICARMMEVNVTMTGDERSWGFEYSTFKESMQWLHERFTIWVREKHYSHSIYVPIIEGDKISAGRLDVKI